MTTRCEAIDAVIDRQNNLFGLMDTAFDFTDKTVAESIQETKDIQTACSQYLEALHEMESQHIGWLEVLDYAEENGG